MHSLRHWSACIVWACYAGRWAWAVFAVDVSFCLWCCCTCAYACTCACVHAYAFGVWLCFSVDVSLCLWFLCVSTKVGTTSVCIHMQVLHLLHLGVSGHGPTKFRRHNLGLLRADIHTAHTHTRARVHIHTYVRTYIHIQVSYALTRTMVLIVAQIHITRISAASNTSLGVYMYLLRGLVFAVFMSGMMAFVYTILYGYLLNGHLATNMRPALLHPASSPCVFGDESGLDCMTLHTVDDGNLSM